MPLTKAQAKSLDILEVARSLGMEMKRKSHREYYWAEHDSFKIDTVKNTWHWYSQNLFGDTINLVQQMQNVSYKEAMVFLETGSFPEAKPVEEERKPFNYTLAPYEQPFVEARTYLKEIRGLSDDTIDFFLEKGVLSQAKRKDKDGVIEDVLVFKYLDRNQQLVGASLQGLVPDQERHPGKGYLKQIMYQSESISGLNVSIGFPKRLIVTEAPIDLMSYYELHKGELNDVRLVAMEGLKEGVLSHYVLEMLQDRGEIAMDERDYTKSNELTRTSKFLSVAAETSTLFQDHKYDDLITLAVDHDKAGTDFITKLQEKNIPVIDARPPKREGQEKTDWNEILKQEKQLEQTEEIQASSHFPDTSHLSPEDATWLKENWNNIGFSVEPKKQMIIDSDKTVTFEKPSNPLGDSSRALEENQSTEKALGKSQEQNMNSEYQKNERTNGSQGSLQPKAEGSPTPVPEVGTFERSVTSRPTLSSHLLYFSINEEFQSSNDGHYHSISSHELAKLNRPIRSQTIQNAAQYYLDELANSKVYYVTPDKTVQVNFEEKHFMHLTGIKPIGSGQTPEKTLRDFAEGNGRFDNILLANNDAAFDKLKVLSDLSVATESTSFYFDDLTDLRRYNGRFDSLIKSDDKDIILLFKELEEDNYIPVSVFQSRTKLVKELETVDRIPILGVYREREGQIEQLSINEGLIADGGKEMMENLQRREFEEINSKEEMIQDNPERTLPSPDEKIRLHNRKDEMDRDLDGDGISNSDEMLQGTDPYNAASNLHKKQEERERRIDAEVAAGAIITEALATKNSERSISQMVAEKDTKALAEHLKEGMKNYLDSDQFKSFLDTMSKFHNYSLNNIHLLKMQNPNVTQVASFNKWKTDFDRTVKKGARALKVWVPYQVKTKIPENQKELNFSPSENEMDQKEITVTRFKLGNVFDVSQTEGKELPKAIHELTGSVKDYEDLYRAAKAVSMDNQVPISFEEIKRENTRGYYSPSENRIVISKKLKGEEHILKTIFHEMAHADLHKGTNAQYGDDQYRKQELQAESVAYVVASHFGFDTSSYSFGYLAIWAKDKNGFEDMVEQLQVVQKEAKSLIDRMDAKLELVKNKTVVKDKFADKLQQAKEQSEKLSNQKAEAVKQVEEKKSLSSPH